MRRFSPEGALDEVIEVGVSQPTSCAFGGSGRDQLFITTSRQGLTGGEPAAGALFRVEVDAVGQPARTFRG